MLKSYSEGLNVPVVLQADIRCVTLLLQETGKVWETREFVPVQRTRACSRTKSRRVWMLPNLAFRAVEAAHERMFRDVLPNPWSIPEHKRGLNVRPPDTYYNQETNAMLGQILGPKFPQRWWLANEYAFLQPVYEHFDRRFVQNFCRYWPGGEMWSGRLRWLDVNRESLGQVFKDGYARLLPMLHTLSLPDPARGTDPLQQFRGMVTKAQWKAICAQSASRVQHIALSAIRVHGHPIDAPLWHPDDHLEHMLSLLPVPTTLMVSSTGMQGSAKRLEVLGNLARQKPYRYKDHHEYNRLMHMWDDVNRFLGGMADPNWSPRRIRDEHHRFVAAQREEDRQRMLADAQSADEVFVLRKPVPWDFSDLKTGHVVRLLRTKREYVDRGTVEQHCVGSYARNGSHELCYTYTIHTEQGHSISTAMFEDSGRLLQHYGFRNDHIIDEEVNRIVYELQDLISNLRVEGPAKVPTPLVIGRPVRFWNDEDADPAMEVL